METAVDDKPKKKGKSKNKNKAEVFPVVGKAAKVLVSDESEDCVMVDAP